MGKFEFFKASLKNMKTVGAIARSSPALSKKMVNQLDLENVKVVVEIGAGDGPITKVLLESLPKDAKLISFEILPKLAAKLREIDDPRLLVIEDSAENLPAHLKRLGIENVDGIVSAIPFTMIPEEQTRKIISVCRGQLGENAPFIQVHYSLLIKSIYDSLFSDVRINFVLVNMPPAFVFTCTG